MDFFDLVNKRRSVRKFSNEKVPKEVILKSLKAALLAANSSNLQPWEFYWVRDNNKKKTISYSLLLSKCCKNCTGAYCCSFKN